MPIVLRWLLRLGPLNPIAVRLVQSGSRRPKHFLLRMGYLGTLMVALMWMLVVNTAGDQVAYRDLAAGASNAFVYIAFLQIGLICVLAPVFMAGAIAQEADPRTWDILLTTPLGAAEIVLGNLLGRLFLILALLVSSLPLFGVTQLFGGVPGESIFASYGIAAGAATLVGTTAVALSVSRVVGRRAVFTFYVSVVSYLAVTLAADRISGGGSQVTYLTAVNPFLALQALLDPLNYQRAPAGSLQAPASWFLEHPVTTWVGLSLGLSIVLIALSIITVRIGGIAGVGGLGGRDSGAGGGEGAGGGAVGLLRRALGLGAAGSQRRPARWVWSNPVAWREAASRNATLPRILARWSFILAGLVGGAVVVGLFHSGTVGLGTFRSLLLYTVLGEIIIIALVAVNMSATSITREREDGTLDLLLTTPITPRQYLAGKLRGMVAYLLPMLSVPLATLGMAGLYAGMVELNLVQSPLPLVVALQPGTTGWGATPVAPPAPISVPALLSEGVISAALVSVPFIAVCVMVGMSFSLRNKSVLTAVTQSIGIVAAFSGVIGLCAWNAAPSVPLLGPVLGAFSPASVVYAAVFPEHGLTYAFRSGPQLTPRVSLVVGAAGAALVQVLVVYSLLASITRTFDVTVRKLAGVK